MSRRENDFTITARIDTRGQSTAWSILCAERALEDLLPGQVLEVNINDPQLANDLPRILEQRGEVLLTSFQGGEELRLYVRRGADYQSPANEN